LFTVIRIMFFILSSAMIRMMGLVAMAMAVEIMDFGLSNTVNIMAMAVGIMVFGLSITVNMMRAYAILDMPKFVIIFIIIFVNLATEDSGIT